MDLSAEKLYEILRAALLAPVYLAFVIFCAGCFKKIRLKRYRGNIAFFIICGSCMPGVLIASLMCFYLSHNLLAESLVATFYRRDSIAVAVWFLCFVLCSISLMLVVTRKLPVQKLRLDPGRPRGWFYFAGGYALCGLFFIAIAFSREDTWESSNYRYNIGNWFFFICLASVSFWIAYGFLRRARASRRFKDVVKEDLRAPVVYLRVFNDEKLQFDFRPQVRRKRRKFHMFSFFTDSLPFAPLDYGMVSLDLYLTHAVEAAMGPFIALGNPEDQLATVGAAREYFGGDDWREEVQRMVGQCNAVIALPGNSRGLEWELTWMLKCGFATKLFLLFGRWVYGTPSYHVDKFLNPIYPVPEPLVWDRYRDDMKALGYTLPLDAPDVCTVVAFNAAGDGRTISRSCGSPEEYVNAIVNHLKRVSSRQAAMRVIITPPPTASR